MFLRPFTLALLAVLFCSGCARRGLVLTERADSEARAVVIGDVRTVERGEATQRRMWSIPASALSVGIGTGAVAFDDSRQGTAIFLNGTGYVHSLDPDEFGKVEKSSDDIFTSFAVGIPEGARPSARYVVNGGRKGIPLSEIYGELAGRHNAILLAVGVGEFAFSETQVLMSAPNRGVPLSGERKAEFYELNRHVFDPAGVFVGIVLPDAAELRGSNLRVFSRESGGESRPRDQVSRTHFARLDSIQDVKPDELGGVISQVEDVSRLLSMSRLRSGEIVVYVIDDFDKR